MSPTGTVRMLVIAIVVVLAIGAIDDRNSNSRLITHLVGS